MADAFEVHDFEPEAADALPPAKRANGHAPDETPAGFELGERGVFKLIPKTHPETGETTVTRRFVCSPLKVLGRMRGADGLGWGLVCEVQDPDGREHVLSLPASLFAGEPSAVLSQLFDAGLQVGASKEARSGVIQYLQGAQPAGRLLRASGTGWVDQSCSAFVMGDGEVIGAENVIVAGDGAPSAASEMRAQGDLEGWKRNVAALCVGNSLLVLSASTAFTPPLLDILGVATFGLHYRGKSSSGKSTNLQVARSAWGAPALLQSWRATSNGLEGVAAGFNGSLLALDELGEAVPAEAAAAVYMLGNEQGRKRALRDGRARRAQRWRLAFLSSGELGLADKIAEGGKRATAGQAVRLIELPADWCAYGAFDDLHGAEHGAAFADRVTAAAAENFGTAARAFVAQIIAEGRDQVAAHVQALMAAFNDAAEAEHALRGADGQVRRVAERFALISAAGELATLWEITGWPEGAAHAAALEAFGDWLSRRGGALSQERADAIERTRGYLLSFGPSRFVRLDDQDRNPPERAGWADDESFYVHPAAWRHIHAGADATRAAEHLAGAGFLRRGGERDRLTVRVDQVRARPRAYQVLRSILAGDDVPDASS